MDTRSDSKDPDGSFRELRKNLDTRADAKDADGSFLMSEAQPVSGRDSAQFSAMSTSPVVSASSTCHSYPSTLHFIIKNMVHNKRYGSMDLLLELLLELLLLLLLYYIMIRGALSPVCT